MIPLLSAKINACLAISYIMLYFCNMNNPYITAKKNWDLVTGDCSSGLRVNVRKKDNSITELGSGNQVTGMNGEENRAGGWLA